MATSVFPHLELHQMFNDMLRSTMFNDCLGAEPSKHIFDTTRTTRTTQTDTDYTERHRSHDESP